MVYDKSKQLRAWSPEDWRKKPILQNIIYKDTILLAENLELLKQRPALLSRNSVLKCKRDLANLEQENAFIIQAGDCAETIKPTPEAVIYAEAMSNFIIELSVKLAHNLNRKILSFARMAGQMAKARSLNNDASDLSLYRGDLINSFINREADSNRLLQAYDYNKQIMAHVNKSIYFCHELFLLLYEEALVRDNYTSSSHLLWIGERTRAIDYAHIEFARNLENPIAVKIGPNIVVSELLQLCDILNPNNEKGKLSFIIRMGAAYIENKLGPLIDVIKRANKNILWICDPMHGNNILYDGYKTRYLSAIKTEIESFFNIHKKMNSYAAGIHLELTYEDVTECLSDVKPDWQNYKTYCDARLNASQSHEIIDFLANILS